MNRQPPEWLQALAWRVERRHQALEDLPKRLRTRRRRDQVQAVDVLDVVSTLVEHAGDFSAMVDELVRPIRVAAGLEDLPESGGDEHGMGGNGAG